MLKQTGKQATEAIKRLVEYNHEILPKYYEYRGMWDDKLQLGLKTWELMEREDHVDSGDRGKVALEIGSAYRRPLENSSEAIEWYNKAIGCFEEHGESSHDDLGKALRNRADVYRSLGDTISIKESIRSYEDVLKRNLVSDQSEKGKLLSSLGDAYHRIGNLEKAQETLLESLRIHESLGDLYEVHQSKRYLSALMLDKGEPQEAYQYASKAVSYFSNNNIS